MAGLMLGCPQAPDERVGAGQRGTLCSAPPGSQTCMSTACQPRGNGDINGASV